MSFIAKERPQLTPKDFVLYAAMMFTLVVSIGAFIVLLFQYIEFLYPDPLQYTDPYGGAMRYAIATLIVLFPIFLALTRMTNQEVRKHPEKKELPFRKWLIYIALLAGGLVLVFDLIAVINSFLGGDLTTQFALKALSIFVVVGGAFTYYLLLLRGYWDTRESASKVYGAVVAGFVALTIIAGFFIMGSPAEQRERRFDEQRIGHLNELQWQVTSYWERTGELPASLAAIDNELYYTVQSDPETNESYEYEQVSDVSFSLCATFNRPSNERLTRGGKYPIHMYGLAGESSWEHDAGRHCFERTIDPERHPSKNDMRPRPAPLLD
jgi:hypothetical protein